jgi:hypothetical protein
MYGKKILGLVLTVSVVLGLTFSPARAQQQGFFPPWLGDAVEGTATKYFFGPLESTMGNFSMGTYLTDPIEEQIPGLDLLGLVRNRTWGYSHGPRDQRRNRFNMIEWQAELEARYQVSPDLEFTAIFDYRYDAVFDWDNSFRYRGVDYHGFPKGVESELAYYHRTKQILRELFVNYSITTRENGAWNFRFGKQQVGLGKQDFNVIDKISSQFNTVGPISIPGNLEWDRIPAWMFNISYIFPERIIPNLSMKFIWIPDFEPNSSNQIAGAANFVRSAPPATDDVVPKWEWKRKDKDWSLGGSEWAFNINYILPWGGWDLGVWYLSDWDETPTTFTRYRSDGTSYSDRRHVRHENIMWGLDKNLQWFRRFWSIKIEQRFTINDYLPTTKERSGTSSGHHNDGVKKANFLFSSINLGTKWLRGNLGTNLIWINAHYLKYDEQGFQPFNIWRPASDIIVYVLQYNFPSFEDRLLFNVTNFHRINNPDQDMRSRIRVQYGMGNFTKFYFDYNILTGEPPGGYGRFEDMDTWRFGVEHHF